MDENLNLHEEQSEEKRKKEQYSKISISILNMEIENAKDLKQNDKSMINNIVKLIEREIR